MALYVKKFGGSSVATPEKMLNIANRVLRDRKPGDKIVIVVSAMGDSTDDLLDLAAKVSDVNYARERDMLLSTGEQVSIALMAMTFKKLGVPAISLTGPQAGIVAGGGYGKATIDDVKPDRVFKELEAGNIVIVAGFQGMMPNGDIATLGRGGSDATAVALAGAMHADMCEIFTDVDGVYSADPRHVTGTINQDLPILRPLIGMDKTEIIETSRHIGTYETSILPYEDCCTIFTPPHPKIRPELAEILEAEAAMPGLAELEAEAAENTERIRIRITDEIEFEG